MLQRWIITPTDEMTYKLAVFKNITHATLALRRAEIQKARLELDARRLELLAEKQRNKSASASASSSPASSTPETTSTEPIGIGDSGASRKEASRPSASTPTSPSAPTPPRSESPAPPNGKPNPQNGAPQPPPPETGAASAAIAKRASGPNLRQSSRRTRLTAHRQIATKRGSSGPDPSIDSPRIPATQRHTAKPARFTMIHFDRYDSPILKGSSPSLCSLRSFVAIPDRRPSVKHACLTLNAPRGRAASGMSRNAQRGSAYSALSQNANCMEARASTLIAWRQEPQLL
jgi:hypothetical protein